MQNSGVRQGLFLNYGVRVGFDEIQAQELAERSSDFDWKNWTKGTANKLNVTHAHETFPIPKWANNKQPSSKPGVARPPQAL